MNRLRLLSIYFAISSCHFLFGFAVKGWPATAFERLAGHYPGSYCHFTDVILHPNEKDAVFLYRSDNDAHARCDGVKAIWPLKNFNDSTVSIECFETYDIAHVFTIYYWFGSNYFHLHYDMMIPLYLAAHFDVRTSSTIGRSVFMPTVESSRLNKLDWNTKAFDDPSKFWVQMSKIIAGQHVYKPLNKDILEAGKTICFKNVYFGTPRVQFDDAPLIQGFIDFVRSSLDIPPITIDTPNKIGIVTRSTRRRILNEKELLSSLNNFAPTDIIEFSGLSFKEQVQLMSNYTVLVAVNGAGLTNALYLPPHGVPIQIIPYKAELNFREFELLLRSRGEYAEWHNRYENLTEIFPSEKGTSSRHSSNTIVHIQEFEEVLKTALALVEEKRRKLFKKDEL